MTFPADKFPRSSGEGERIDHRLEPAPGHKSHPRVATLQFVDLQRTVLVGNQHPTIGSGGTEIDQELPYGGLTQRRGDLLPVGLGDIYVVSPAFEAIQELRPVGLRW